MFIFSPPSTNPLLLFLFCANTCWRCFNWTRRRRGLFKGAGGGGGGGEQLWWESEYHPSLLSGHQGAGGSSEQPSWCHANDAPPTPHPPLPPPHLDYKVKPTPLPHLHPLCFIIPQQIPAALTVLAVVPEGLYCSGTGPVCVCVWFFL